MLCRRTIGVGGLLTSMGLTFTGFEMTGHFISQAIVVILHSHAAFVSIGAMFPKDVSSSKLIGKIDDLGITKAAEFFLPYGAFIVNGRHSLYPDSIECHHVFFLSNVIFNGKTVQSITSAKLFKYRTPYVAIILSGTIMAVMAYALSLIKAGVIFLLLFTQVNIAVIKL